MLNLTISLDGVDSETRKRIIELVEEQNALRHKELELERDELVLERAKLARDRDKMEIDRAHLELDVRKEERMALQARTASETEARRKASGSKR